MPATILNCSLLALTWLGFAANFSANQILSPRWVSQHPGRILSTILKIIAVNLGWSPIIFIVMTFQFTGTTQMFNNALLVLAEMLLLNLCHDIILDSGYRKDELNDSIQY